MTSTNDKFPSIERYAEPETGYEQSRSAVAEAFQSGDGERITKVLRHELHARRTEDLSGLSPQIQADKLVARTQGVLPTEELLERLEMSQSTGVPLRVKYGIDPTGSDVHIGHAVPMLLLDRLRRMGHTVQFVVGDFTAKIGDPSGRVASRPVLTDEQIAKNMETYTSQIAPLFDMDGVEIFYNGNWLSRYPLSDLMGVLSQVSASQTLQRNDFRGRLNTGLTLAEVMYPVAMALDSVELDTDIELGGKDQLLNLQMCRTVMSIHGKRPEVVMTTDIMEGTDGSGRKMGKSYNNYVGLTQDPSEIFGRIMSIPDSLMEQYYKMITEIEDSEWEGIKALMDDKSINPMDFKKTLAFDLVNVLHGDTAAEAAEAEFVQKFSKKQYAEVQEMPELEVVEGVDPNGLVALIASALSAARGTKVSNSQVRRVFAQGGIKLVDAEGGEALAVASPEALEAGIYGARVLKVGKTLLRISSQQ